MDCTARMHASTSEATMTVKRHEPSTTYTVEPWWVEQGGIAAVSMASG